MLRGFLGVKWFSVLVGGIFPVLSKLDATLSINVPCVTARSLMMLVSCRGMFQKASCSVNLSALASVLSKGSDSTLRVTGP